MNQTYQVILAALNDFCCCSNRPPFPINYVGIDDRLNDTMFFSKHNINKESHIDGAIWTVSEWMAFSMDERLPYQRWPYLLEGTPLSKTHKFSRKTDPELFDEIDIIIDAHSI